MLVTHTDTTLSHYTSHNPHTLSHTFAAFRQQALARPVQPRSRFGEPLTGRDGIFEAHRGHHHAHVGRLCTMKLDT